MPTDVEELNNLSPGAFFVKLGTKLKQMETLINELRDDHATFITEQTAIGATLADFKAIYDAHTHTADGNASRTSLPDTGSPTGSPSAASAFTDTSGSPPATITAAAVDTLSN